MSRQITYGAEIYKFDHCPFCGCKPQPNAVRNHAKHFDCGSWVAETGLSLQTSKCADNTKLEAARWRLCADKLADALTRGVGSKAALAEYKRCSKFAG